MPNFIQQNSSLLNNDNLDCDVSDYSMFNPSNAGTLFAMILLLSNGRDYGLGLSCHSEQAANCTACCFCSSRLSFPTIFSSIFRKMSVW